MNHREPPQLPAGVRKALHCLSFAVLPVLASESAHAQPRIRPPGSGPEVHHTGIPYLKLAGAPPLRFQLPEPVPEASPLHSLELEPSTDPDTVKSQIASANSDAALAATDPGDGARETRSESVASEPTPSAPVAKPPAPILRDSLVPTVRPEDFLPYFQIPGSAQDAGDVTLLVPAAPAARAPAPVPSSSATYRQTP